MRGLCHLVLERGPRPPTGRAGSERRTPQRLGDPSRPDGGGSGICTHPLPLPLLPPFPLFSFWHFLPNIFLSCHTQYGPRRGVGFTRRAPRCRRTSHAPRRVSPRTWPDPGKTQGSAWDPKPKDPAQSPRDADTGRSPHEGWMRSPERWTWPCTPLSSAGPLLPSQRGAHSVH